MAACPCAAMTFSADERCRTCGRRGNWRKAPTREELRAAFRADTDEAAVERIQAAVAKALKGE